MLFVLLLGFGTQMSAQTADDKVRGFLSSQQAGDDTSGYDSDWTVTSEHVSTVSGIHHIYFVQKINNIPVVGTSSSIHLEGEKPVYSSLRLIRDAQSKVRDNGSPTVLALEAVKTGIRSISREIYPAISVKTYSAAPRQKTIIDAGTDFLEVVEAELIYLPYDDSIRLCWEFMLMEHDLNAFTKFRVDALNGELLETSDELIRCWFDETESTTQGSLNYNFDPYPPGERMEAAPDYQCSGCYEVVPLPYKNPYETERVILQTSGHPVGSPYGWHDTNGEPGVDFYNTKGNNTDTWVGQYSQFRPYGGKELNFTGFEFGQDYTEEMPYMNASGTNLFYLVNKAHDIFYIYGFDEKAGNFQKNNYGRGGIEGDWLGAVSQSLEQCNAGIVVRGDGGRSSIFNYTCHGKDGAFDATAVLHEYAHGLIRRLIGGPDDVGCVANRERAEEGYCDWFGMMLTMKADDQGEMPVGIANYLFDYGISGPGIRPYPYSTDLNVNPDTYGSTNNLQYIHHIGAVFGQVLWEVTWALIEDYGFDSDLYNFTGNVDQDAGNIMALAIMIEALKLMPCKPGFVDTRDAIFRAARNIYDDRLECTLWRAFAKRGLGVTAHQGSTYTNDDNIEAFDMPPEIASFNGLFDLCQGSPVIYNQYGGNPYGGVYSGPGVIDDGNGMTYTFDPSVAGLGTHTITYTIEDSDCTIASSANGTVTIFKDVESPNLFCPEYFTVQVDDYSGSLQMPDLAQFVAVSDNCSTSLQINQTPEVGSSIDKTFHSEVYFETTDLAGNPQSCSSILILTLKEPDPDKIIELYPNPSRGTVYISKRSLNDFHSVDIFDIRGRLVRSYDLSHVNFQTEINIESLDSGLYFLKFDTQDGTVLKRILRE